MQLPLRNNSLPNQSIRYRTKMRLIELYYQIKKKTNVNYGICILVYYILGIQYKKTKLKNICSKL